MGASANRRGVTAVGAVAALVISALNIFLLVRTVVG